MELGFPLFYGSSMLGWGYDKCVLSDKLILVGFILIFGGEKKGGGLRNKNTLRYYFNSVPKYWMSFFLNKFTLNTLCTMF
jgi:hypothetical protein